MRMSATRPMSMNKKPIKTDDFGKRSWGKRKRNKTAPWKTKNKTKRVRWKKQNFFKKEKARGKQRNWKRTMDEAKYIEQRVERHLGT